MHFSRSLRQGGRAAGLIWTLMAASALGACAAGASDADVASGGDELKGGIPANGKEKSKNGMHLGQAGGAAIGDSDAGVKVKGPKGKGAAGQGADANDKTTKTNHGKGNASAGTGGDAEDSDHDESADDDESAEEGA